MSYYTLKNLEELSETNLKGYGYYVAAWGMTMTSRHAYDPELWIVVEDDGENCKVARHNKDGVYKWTETRNRARVVESIHDYPCISAETKTNFIQQIQ